MRNKPLFLVGVVVIIVVLFFVSESNYFENELIQNNNPVIQNNPIRTNDNINSFQSSFSWEIYDATKNDVGISASGYLGAIDDGRYVYFAPSNNGRGYHGEVLRYDTTQDFESTDAWNTFDTKGKLGYNPVGYADITFDGRYVYFAPYNNNEIFHGEVLRYDTTQDFEDVKSWSTFDPSKNGVGIEPRGYIGLVFDDTFIYFVPDNKGLDAVPHSEVLRYDTRLEFQSSESWQTFDAKLNGVGENPVGFIGGVFDGRYVYFSPFWHNEVLRYDTTQDFESTDAWNTFDAKLNGLDKNFGGYWGRPAFDGKYIYFSPYGNQDDGLHGEVLRYDTTQDFESISSWQTFDAKLNGVGENPVGYNGAEFDGRYVYFSPAKNESGYHGEVLRYDTTQDFGSKNSWNVIDVNSFDTKEIGGYYGIKFVGKYLYFVPFRTDDGANGKVLRYDTTQDFESTDAWKIFDVLSNSGSSGYAAAISDGKYIYFSPLNSGVQYHDKVLRYDTTQDFGSKNSWDHMHLKNLGSTDFTGYSELIFDNQYVYFLPLMNNAGLHSNIIRYDTQNNFESVDSWEHFNPLSDLSISIAFIDAEFDGRFIYFSTMSGDESISSLIVRYDTTQDFGSPTSWKLLDLKENGIKDNVQIMGSSFDGKYVYFLPMIYDSGLVRYDTTQDFENVESWSTLDYDKLGIERTVFTDAIFDGRSLYLSPLYSHMPFLKYDTTQDFENLNSWSAFFIPGESYKSGFNKMIFDGKYIYTTPSDLLTSQQHHVDTFVVYDTTKDFISKESWDLYSMGTFENKQVFFTNPVIENNVIYFPSLARTYPLDVMKPNSGFFLKLDLDE